MVASGKLLHEVGHNDRLAAAELSGTMAVAQNASGKLTDFITETFTIPLVEVLLVLVLVLEAEFKVVGLPPRSRDVSMK